MGLPKVIQGWPATWPKPDELFHHLAPRIVSLHAAQVFEGHRAILRFTNDLGVNIFRYAESEIFEMTVLRFHGEGVNDFEFAFDTPVPDLNLGYADEDIAELCAQVAHLS